METNPGGGLLLHRHIPPFTRRYMAYFCSAAHIWFCQFSEEDLKTSLPRKVRLSNPAKIVEMAERGGAAMLLEDRQALDYEISRGRGSVWLNLTPDHHLLKIAIADAIAAVPSHCPEDDFTFKLTPLEL